MFSCFSLLLLTELDLVCSVLDGIKLQPKQERGLILKLDKLTLLLGFLSCQLVFLSCS